MSLETKKDLTGMSFIESAYEIFSEKKQAILFANLIEELKERLALSDEQMLEKMPQFYTDLNVDGRFICLNDRQWGLKDWYPFDQVDEEVMVTKTKKKKVKKELDEDIEDTDKPFAFNEDETFDEDLESDVLDEDLDELDDIFEDEIEEDLDELEEETEVFTEALDDEFDVQDDSLETSLEKLEEEEFAEEENEEEQT